MATQKCGRATVIKTAELSTFRLPFVEEEMQVLLGQRKLSQNSCLSSDNCKRLDLLQKRKQLRVFNAKFQS